MFAADSERESKMLVNAVPTLKVVTKTFICEAI